ncbi:MAG TPA: hypothetical protein PLR76_14760 [Hyphomonas sp.]|nr:hypothetical protein [Hyphomonas sp.]MCA8904774.1 hypothetical protein [Hyphomonas sp.]MCB9969910.1 hypothetical protein [Hyphomonas sp.]HPE49662.1 hypothetical protein [Hyphomonas sp.]
MTYEIESTPEEAFLELVSPETGSVHELQKEQLADAVHSLPALADDLGGVVSSRNQTVYGRGPFCVKSIQQDLSYRANGGLFLDDSTEAPADAAWYTPRANTTLGLLQAKFGDNLLMYDSCKRTISASIFGVPVYSKTEQSVRALVRR